MLRPACFAARKLLFLIGHRTFCDQYSTGFKNLEVSTSLDDLRTFFFQKLVAAIGAEKLDLFVAKLLIVTIEIALALRAGHPENFCHDSRPPGLKL